MPEILPIGGVTLGTDAPSSPTRLAVLVRFRERLEADMFRSCKIARCALLPLALICTAAAAAEPSFEDGRRAYDFGDYSAAKTIWVALAQAGDARSQTSLGYLYREGKGVARDAETAARWYYRAALRDEPTAQAALCDIHLKGDGVRRDFRTAFFWCELSISGGETSAIGLREHAMRRITAEQRDLAWAMIAEWRNVRHDALRQEAQAQEAGRR
ncbi:MAG TPA: tetratricopeptide repeat protein [Xanthobacteraceae bacterium]|nr:tetratricopeptide repeat protein [Xanthobacteraceae bacterium]